MEDFKIMDNRAMTVINFECSGKEGDIKTMVSEPQCYFKGKKALYDGSFADILAVTIGVLAMNKEEYSDKDSLRWITAQPFESITVAVRLKKDGIFNMAVLGNHKPVKRV